IDVSARLLEGMTLQVFANSEADLSRVVTMREADVQVIPVGSEEFFAYWESLKGKRRTIVQVRDGDTLDRISKRFGIPVASLERINRRGRKDTLRESDQVVVYLPEQQAK